MSCIMQVSLSTCCLQLIRYGKKTRGTALHTQILHQRCHCVRTAERVLRYRECKVGLPGLLKQALLPAEKLLSHTLDANASDSLPLVAAIGQPCFPLPSGSAISSPGQTPFQPSLGKCRHPHLRYDTCGTASNALCERSPPCSLQSYSRL